MLQRWAVSFLTMLVLIAPELAAAKPGFGEQVDAYCSGLGRGTPFASLAGRGFLSECTLCHAFTFPPDTPSRGNLFDPPATQFLNGRASGNFSYFCPGAMNALPVIAPIADRSVNVGQLVVIDVTASDADGQPLVLTVSNAPAAASFVDHGNGTATFTWTPGVADIGSRTVNFMVHDNAVPPGQALEPVTITVGSSNRPPVLGAIGNRAGDPGVLLEFTVSATDPDGDTLALTASPLPQGATFSDAHDGTGVFSWTPASGQVGNHGVTFTVTDSGLPPATDSENVTLTIGHVNAPPVLAPIGNRTTKVGQALHVALSATDADGDVLALSETGLPAGATFADAGNGTGAIDWTPVAADVGSHPVTVTVTDAGTPPASDSESFTLVVQPEAQPSAARIDDASWNPRAEKLYVRGSGAEPRQMIGVLDADSGLVLGSRNATKRGGFKLVIAPTAPPCAVQLQAGDVRGERVPVRGAPADCGRAPTVELEATWRCSDDGDGDDDDGGTGVLDVGGSRAPGGARIEVRDATSHAVLGATQADKRGRFHLSVAAAGAPASIEVGVSAGPLAWTAGPIPVGVDCGDDGESDD